MPLYAVIWVVSGAFSAAAGSARKSDETFVAGSRIFVIVPARSGEKSGVLSSALLGDTYIVYQQKPLLPLNSFKHTPWGCGLN
jgi:hypothetical protein